MELCEIFQRMCEQNQYELTPDVRCKLLWGFQWLHEHRDEHFGNGGLVRNAFESSIRHLANRVADVVPITTELLTVLQAEDIELPDVPAAVSGRADASAGRFRVACPQCGTLQPGAWRIPRPPRPLQRLPERFRRRVGRAHLRLQNE